MHGRRCGSVIPWPFANSMTHRFLSGMQISRFSVWSHLSRRVLRCLMPGMLADCQKTMSVNCRIQQRPRPIFSSTCTGGSTILPMSHKQWMSPNNECPTYRPSCKQIEALPLICHQWLMKIQLQVRIYRDVMERVLCLTVLMHAAHRAPPQSWPEQSVSRHPPVTILLHTMRTHLCSHSQSYSCVL